MDNDGNCACSARVFEEQTPFKLDGVRAWASVLEPGFLVVGARSSLQQEKKGISRDSPHRVLVRQPSVSSFASLLPPFSPPPPLWDPRYIEKYEKDDDKLDQVPSEALSGLVALGLKLSQLRELTGRENPTVIT